MTPQIKHVLLLTVTAALGVAYEMLGPKGPWSHAFWAPVGVALVTSLQAIVAKGTP